MTDEFADYERLLARIDAHSAAVAARWPDEFACRAGCSGCCHRQLSVFPVEAARIRLWLAEQGLSPEAEGESFVDPETAPEGASPCAFLDRAGRCRVYAVRPLICRTHGLPLAVPDPEGGLRGDTCPLNFRSAGLGGLPSSDFLSLTPVNTVLAAVNAHYVAQTGADDARVDLSDLAAEANP